jgi:phage protein D
MSTATVTDIGKALEERINAIIESGHLTYEDNEVTEECARRYVDTERRKRERNLSRDVEQTAKVNAENRARIRAKVSLRLNGIVDEIRTELSADWSPDLLASSFALKDGARVTWADATFDQHEEYAVMMEGLAAGDLHTAAIHRQAMHDIKARGVASLAELLP